MKTTIKIIALIAILGAIFSFAQGSHAAVNAPMTGEIERITLNNPADHWSGGTIVVGGQNVIIPRNLLIDLPANRLTLKQIFDQAPAACLTMSPAESGLAKADKCNTSGAGGIAVISVNRTNAGNAIAGDVFIMKGVEMVTGQVTYINYTDGYFRLNGALNDATTGIMVRLNDPTSRHTVQQGLGCPAGAAPLPDNCSPDPRFTLDPDNYVSVFSTGYPFCIPSTVQRTFVDVLGLGITTSQAAADGTGDVLCPSTNRTAAVTEPAVADSRRFAPIVLGDHITAEGNFETINGVRFLSSHTTSAGKGLTTKPDAGQPDYIFLAEFEVDAPGFQNQRLRTLMIGFATLGPPDVLIWSLHRDPLTNEAHEFPLASVLGCDIAGGAGTCGGQGVVGQGTLIWKIRHDVDFLVGAKPKVNPCAHLLADSRMGTGICPGGNGELNIRDMFGILSPIPHEVQARTGKKFASLQPGGTPLVTIDVNGNEATNGQYLFPFGVNLGGIAFPEMVEIDLNALNIPFSFSGIPWNLDRRLSPGGCIDTSVPPDGIVDCDATPQPLDPFPFEGIAFDPRNLANIPTSSYNAPKFTASALSNVRNRILSYVTEVSPGVFNFNGNSTVLAWPPVDPAALPIVVTPALALVCGTPGSLNFSPLAVNDSASMPFGAPSVVINVVSNDLAFIGTINAGTVAVVSLPVNGTVLNNGDGTVTYSPNAGFSGTDSFTYTVQDTAVPPGTSNTGAVTVTVGPPPVNEPPHALNDPATTTPGTAVVIDVLANDTDADGTLNPASLAIASAPANGTAVPNAAGDPAGTIRYTPNAGFTGTDTFAYTVNDNLNAPSNQATVTVTVASLSNPPAAVNDTATTAKNTAVTFAVIGNDTDTDGTIDPTTVQVAGVPAHGTATVNATTGEITYTPAVDFIGIDMFGYTVRDNSGVLSNIATVTLTVVPVLSLPTAVNDAATTAVGAPVVIDVLANDSDIGATLVPGSVTVLAGSVSPPGSTTAVNLVTGAVTFSPPATFGGPASFQYAVADTLGAVSAPATVSITVSGTLEQIAVLNAEYRIGSGWDVRGSSSRPGATITIHLGTNIAGTVVGTAVVRNNGSWDFRPGFVTPPDPGTITNISVTSSGGGTFIGAPLIVRN